MAAGGFFLADLGFGVGGQATLGLGLGLAGEVQRVQASFLPTSSHSLKASTSRVRHSTPGTQSPVTLDKASHQPPSDSRGDIRTVVPPFPGCHEP